MRKVTKTFAPGPGAARFDLEASWSVRRLAVTFHVRCPRLQWPQETGLLLSPRKVDALPRSPFSSMPVTVP